MHDLADRTDALHNLQKSVYKRNRCAVRTKKEECIKQNMFGIYCRIFIHKKFYCRDNNNRLITIYAVTFY